MKRVLLGLGALLGAAAIPAAASAYTARVVADVNMRACAGTSCGIILVLPAGASVNVLGSSGGWAYLTYAGTAGYASANYVTTSVAVRRPPPVVQPYPVYPAYPVYPYAVYPQPYMVSPGLSFSFSFGGNDRDDRRRHH